MSKTLNNKQATIEGLRILGWTVDLTARSRRYIVLVGGYDLGRDRETGEYRRIQSLGAKFLIGRSGGFRKTYSTIDRSISMTDGPLHLALQALGRKEIHLRPNFDIVPCA